MKTGPLTINFQDDCVIFEVKVNADAPHGVSWDSEYLDSCEVERNVKILKCIDMYTIPLGHS